MAFADYTYTFTGAGQQSFAIPRGTKYIRVRSADGSVYFKIGNRSEFSREAGEQINLGQSYPGVEHGVIRSTIAQTVVICVSDEPQDDNRNPVSLAVSASVAPGNTFAGAADVALTAVAATQIIGSDATRLGVIIKNPSTNAASVRVGGSGSVGAAQGIELEPGESVPVATTDEVWGYSVPGETVSVSVVREV